MSGKAAFIYSPAFLDYRIPAGHPFDPLRFAVTVDLLQAMELLPAGLVVPPRQASLEELRLAHGAGYIDLVCRSSEIGRPVDGADLFGLGSEDNPVFPGLHGSAALICGATLTAVDLVMSSEFTHALNIAGGLHHALRDKASGFCVYNDVSVAIAYLQLRHRARVAYVDIDAHHGDGVQFSFYDDPEVLTVSLHETGRFLFPGTGDVVERGIHDGYGYSVNVPLEPFTETGSFLETLESVAAPLIRAFKPDVIISQNGCDGHRLDSMSDLSFTTDAYTGAARLLHGLAHEVCDGRWLATGGGGYEAWLTVPRVWTLLWSEMAGLQAPDAVPSGWHQRWSRHSPVPLPSRLHDSPADFPAMPRRREIAEKNRQTAQRAVAGSFLGRSGG